MNNVFKILLLVLLFFSCKSKKESAEFFKRGNYHFKINEPEKAIYFFNEAINKYPEYADAYNNRGLVYLKINKSPKAIDDFEKAIKIDSKFFEAKFNLAKIYSEIGKTKEADKLYEEITSNYLKSSDFYNFYGQNLVRINQINKSLYSLNKSLQLNPKNIEAITNMGYVYYLQNENEKAKIQFEKALKINPKFPFALNNLAVLLGKNRDFNEAIKLIEDSELILDIVVCNNLTLFYLEKQDLEKAKIYLDKAQKMDEKNAYTKRNAAIFILNSLKPKEAKDLFESLEKTNPEIDYLYYFIGKTFQKLNDKENACKNFKIGVQLNDYWSELELIKCK